MPASSTCSDGSMSTQSSSVESVSSCSTGTSRPLLRSRDDYSDGEEEIRKRRRYTTSPTNPLLFACPFQKTFPTKRRELRACVAGWPSIPRLKQHLTRCHAPNVSCPRCHSSFKTDEDLDLHLTAKSVCLIAPAPRRDETRMTASAQSALNRRIPKGECPKRAWNYIYRILFPEVPEELIPSPFMDITEDKVSSARQDAARELWKHLEGTLPRVIEEETNDLLFTVSNDEVVARLMASISTTMGKFLVTKEDKEDCDILCCSSTHEGDTQTSGHPTCKSQKELSSLEVHKPLNDSALESSLIDFCCAHETPVNIPQLSPTNSDKILSDSFNIPLNNGKPSEPYESKSTDRSETINFDQFGDIPFYSWSDESKIQFEELVQIALPEQRVGIPARGINWNVRLECDLYEPKTK